MASRYWFKPKTYGYGVTPISLEGWLLALGYCAIALACVVLVAIDSGNVMKLLASAAIFVIATIVMIQITRSRIEPAGLGASAPMRNDWKN